MGTVCGYQCVGFKWVGISRWIKCVGISVRVSVCGYLCVSFNCGFQFDRIIVSIHCVGISLWVQSAGISVWFQCAGINVWVSVCGCPQTYFQLQPKITNNCHLCKHTISKYLARDIKKMD